MKARLLALAAGVYLILAGCSVTPELSEPAGTAADSTRVPGKQRDGSILLPNMWSLRPAGKQVALGDFPLNIAIHPSGRFAAVLHCGHGRHEVIFLELPSGDILSQVAINEAFYGLQFSRDGQRLYCSGAGDEVIHEIPVADGFAGKPRAIALRDAKVRGIPCGLAVSADGRALYAANVWGQSISHVNIENGSVAKEIKLSESSPEPVTVAPVAPRSDDEAAIRKRAEAILDQAKSTDPFPYGCVLDEKRGKLYVSLWAQAAVAVMDVNTGAVTARWTVEEHPNEMLLSGNGRYLYVANANRNTVSVVDTETGRAVETLTAALRPDDPPGSTPNSLALNPNESLLFVANANINAVAVFDVSKPGQSRSLGLIPVGWYPTSVRVTPDGKTLLVVNGKGITSRANRFGPQPGQDPPATVREYIGGLMRGTLSVIPLPTGEALEERLRTFTAQAIKGMPQTPDAVLTAEELRNNPIPRSPGAASPIKYCIYIIKENRTYDQILGDMPEGNGDPSLCLFPERVTPNHHQLARDFVLLDNFYVESEVSADGHEWTMGAYATDFVEKTWPLSYGHNKHNKYPYPAEGNFPIARPAGGYLWDRAREAKVSYHSYGEFINNGKTANDPATSRVAALEGNFDPWYRSFDMDYPDVKRAERFLAELKRYEEVGDMPQLMIVRLPNDHTSGTTVGKRTPTAHVADNDLAFGMIIEAITHSKFWPRTAVFVVEDDAQNGPDHVDAHRTIAYAISPYVKRGSVDSTMYTTSSMLRTMELILGLKPMSQFDARAMPMFRSFQARPDLRPYQKRPVTVDMEQRNPRTAWGSEASGQMNFAAEDAADDLMLNEVVWRSVRGPDSPMPAPVRAAFVLVPEEDD